MLTINTNEEVEVEGKATIFLDLVVVYPDPSRETKIVESEWETKLKKAADLKKRTVFRVNALDNEGFISNIIRFWLNYTKEDHVLLMTSEPHVKTVLELTHGNQVRFVGKDDGQEI